jgi:hypothetical protein
VPRTTEAHDLAKVPTVGIDMCLQETEPGKRNVHKLRKLLFWKVRDYHQLCKREEKRKKPQKNPAPSRKSAVLLLPSHDGFCCVQLSISTRTWCFPHCPGSSRRGGVRLANGGAMSRMSDMLT